MPVKTLDNQGQLWEGLVVPEMNDCRLVSEGAAKGFARR